MEKVKTYFPYIDGLKGTAILLMVMAHTLAWSFPDYSFLSLKLCDMSINECYSAFIWKIIYSFHMPLLFAVSGFLFYKPREYNWKNSSMIIYKRITRILVPYLFTGCFVLFLKGYFGYWFLQVLFVINIIIVLENLILYSFKAKLKTELLLHIIVYLSLTYISICLGHHRLPKMINNLSGINSYYMVFMFGYMLRRFPGVLNAISDKWVSFVCFILYILFFTISNSVYHIPLIGMLVPLLAIIFLTSTFIKISFKKSPGEVLLFIGRNSMEIYILHLFFVMPFNEVGLYILNQNNFALSITLQIIYSLVISSIAICLSVGCAKLLKQNKILSILLFGI